MSQTQFDIFRKANWRITDNLLTYKKYPDEKNTIHFSPFYGDSSL